MFVVLTKNWVWSGRKMGVVRTKLGLSGQVRYTHFPFFAKLGLINHLVLFFKCILNKKNILKNMILPKVEKWCKAL